jgi:fructose-specific phosphotransferase system IIC component
MKRSLVLAVLFVLFAINTYAASQTKTVIEEAIAGGMTSCTASSCSQCGNNAANGDAVCITGVRGNGSCECVVSNGKCSGSGTCTYRA